jgi:methylated-DNA-[protein]-cysteine S-methyltransferase
MYIASYSSPVGELALSADEEALTGLRFEGASTVDGRPQRARFDEAMRQLDDYFAGRLQCFDLPLKLAGTSFQQSVWEALRGIGYAETWSYQRLAEKVGRPRATRAVGATNGRNPIAIIVPCHRVIGKDGSLTGFGGGLERKRFLLDLEQARSLACANRPGVRPGL